MGTYVTDTGFIGQTFEENKAYWEDSFKSIFGDSIDLDPEGPIGQLVGIFAKRDTDLWEAAAEIYVSRDPDQATGVALDAICSETGVIRVSASPTVVEDVILYGTVGTTVPTGSQARQSTGDNTSINYLLLSDVTISLSFVRDITVEIQAPSNGETFTITIDGTPYQYIATVPTDDDEAVALALYNLIIAGAFAGDVTLDGATIKLYQEITDFTIALTANIDVDEIGSAGNFEADIDGPFSCVPNTLDTIVTPIAGWDSVNNPVEGIIGRERETDSELRIRRANTLTTGNATEDALVGNVSNNVDGVSRVAIQSNRTDVTDSDGLPPHSFELVVSGGATQDIGDEIWATQGAGIASYGSVSVTVVDSEGNNQTVYLSRPTPIYIHVKVKRDLYSEEDYPADGDAQIKQAIVDWAAINQPIGKDVIRQRLSTPIYSIPGIEDIEVTIDGTPNPGDTPTYAEQNIEILAREFADFDIDRIIVEDLTP